MDGVCYNSEEGFSLNTRSKRHMMFQHFCDTDVALLKLRRLNGFVSDVSLDFPLNKCGNC